MNRSHLEVKVALNETRDSAFAATPWQRGSAGCHNLSLRLQIACAHFSGDKSELGLVPPLDVGS